MTEEKTQEVEEQSTSQEASTDETKDESQVEETTEKTEEVQEQEEEFEQISKEELAKLQQRAQELEEWKQKKRLEKLARKEEVETDKAAETQSSTLDDEQLAAIIDQKVDEKISIKFQQQNKELYEQNLTDAYKDFVSANPWADNDEVISRISGLFNAGGSTSKEQLFAKLDIAAREAYPTEYLQAQEERIKKKILLEEKNIEVGDSGGGTSVKTPPKAKVKANAEDRRIADKMFDGDVERYLKYKNEI